MQRDGHRHSVSIRVALAASSMITASARGPWAPGRQENLPLCLFPLLCSGSGERAPRRRGSCDPAVTDATGGGTEERLGTRTTTRSIPAVTRAVRSDAACRSPAAAGLLAHRIGRAGAPGPGRWGRTRSHAEPASLCVASSNSHMHAVAKGPVIRSLLECLYIRFLQKKKSSCTFSDAADVKTVLVQLSPATRSVRRPAGRSAAARTE